MAAPALMAADKPAPRAPETVAIYDQTGIAYARYTVLHRIPVQDWRSAFAVGGHRDLESARAAVVAEAARLNADGVINLTCFDQTDSIRSRAGHFCYGNAIRLTK